MGFLTGAGALAAAAALLVNAGRIAQFLDNDMLFERRPNRRGRW